MIHYDKGRKGGRPKSLTTEKLKTLKSLVKAKEFSVTKICHMAGISRSVYYRALSRISSEKSWNILNLQRKKKAKNHQTYNIILQHHLATGLICFNSVYKHGLRPNKPPMKNHFAKNPDCIGLTAHASCTNLKSMLPLKALCTKPFR